MKTLLNMLKNKESKISFFPSSFRRHPHDEKRWLRNALFQFLCQSKLVRAWQMVVQRNRPSIVLYHDPDPATFAAHVDELTKHFNLISLREYVNARRNNTLHLLPAYSLIITLDDGLAGNYRLLEVIKRKKVPVTIFLTSGIVDTTRHFWWTPLQSEDDFRKLKKVRNQELASELSRLDFSKEAAYSTRQALSAQEIKKMQPYIDFQAHTRFHPVLPMCTADEAYDEICVCKSELEERFGLDIYALAYPHGDYSERDIELTRQAGYLCALTVDGGLNSKRTNLFRLKRIYMPDEAMPMEAVTKASGLWIALTGFIKGNGPKY